MKRANAGMHAIGVAPLVLLAPVLPASGQTRAIDGFQPGANRGGWQFSGMTVVEPTGGAPHAYLQGPPPQAFTALVSTTGRFRLHR